MAQPKITKDLPIEDRIFHSDSRGMRGITLSKSKSGNRLAVAVIMDDGDRKQVTTYTLPNKDFFVQWNRAVESVRAYYGVEIDSPLHRRMINASSLFLARYKLNIAEQSTTLQVAA